MRPARFCVTLLAALLPVTSLCAQAGGKDAAKPEAKPAAKAGGDATSHLLAVQTLDAEVTKFLKEHKGEAPLAKVVSMQRQALEALQAEPKKEHRDLVVGALDLEVAIEKKDWAEATKAAEAVAKGIPAGLKGSAAADAGSGKAQNLESTMKAINGALKNVGGFLKDPQGEAPIAKVYEIQKRALDAKQADPSKAKSKPEGKEREDFVNGYKKGMRDMIVSTLDLGLAMEKKDWQEAGKLMNELNKEKEDGHKAYKGGRREGGRGGPGGPGGGEDGGAPPAPGKKK